MTTEASEPARRLVPSGVIACGSRVAALSIYPPRTIRMLNIGIFSAP